MRAQKRTVAGALGAALGMIGFSALAGLLVTIMVAPAIAVTGVTANSSIGVFEGLPEFITIGQQKQRNEIYIKTPEGDGRIAVVYDQNRQEVPLDQMADTLKWAAIAGEDHRFYEHGGVDPNSVARAAAGVVTGNDSAGGASTLSMQTVRNILVLEAFNDESLSPEEREAAQAEALDPNAGRKLREMKLAIGLEKEYTKDQILAGYLNIAGFGRNTYGVEAAAQQYFSKSAKDVTIAEAASLISIVQSPNTLNLGNPENFARNQERRDRNIRAMHQYGYIDEAQRDEALAIPVDENFVRIQQPQQGCQAAETYYRFFCDYIVNLAVNGDLPALGSTPEEARANWKLGGYKIYGTLEAAQQVTATQQVQAAAPPTETRFQLGATAASVQVGTGRILVMAQNKDYDAAEASTGGATTAVNFNTDTAYGGGTGFQPGSTYKPFTLLAWLDAGRGLNESFNAGKTTFGDITFKDSCDGDKRDPGWRARNDANEAGSWTVARGTAASVNSVFIQMAGKLDQCAIKDIARDIGVHRASGAQDGSDLYTNPSCVIGGCENNIAPLTMAGAYAAIAGNGVYCKPIAVDRIVNAAGEELPGQNADCHQAIRPEVANTAAFAMEGVMRGTAGASNPNDGTPYMGKTGTTDASVHTWMVGSSSAVATAVWTGNIVGEQALRRISVAGRQASVIRHAIFRPIAQSIDAQFPGVAFPGPSSDLQTGRPTNVPDILGQTPDQALPIVENQELAFAQVGDTDHDAAAGTIVSMSPQPGASVPRGTTVEVVTSNGQGIKVPEVVGLTPADAKSKLKGFKGVKESCREVDDDSSTLDRVAAQSPSGGGYGNKDTVVTIAISKTRC